MFTADVKVLQFYCHLAFLVYYLNNRLTKNAADG